MRTLGKVLKVIICVICIAILIWVFASYNDVMHINPDMNRYISDWNAFGLFERLLVR